MRIVIITEGYYPELSGVTISLHQRLKQLVKLGHHVQVYVPDYSPLKDLYPDYQNYLGEILPGVTVIPFPSKPYYLTYLRDPKPFSFKTLNKTIMEFKPDVIHVECPERLFMGFLTRPGIKLAKQLKIPVTAFYHTNYLACIEDYRSQILFLKIPGIERLLKKILIWVFNSYLLTMVPSKITEDYLKALGIRNTYQDLFLGVDINNYRHPPHLPSSQKARIKIAYIGRLTPEKQVDTLLQIFEAVRLRVDDCEFFFVGGGQELDKVRKWASQFNDTEVIGWVPNQKIASYYWNTDIFVTASPKETYGLTVLEAMASGIPVVGPKAGGVSELVINNETGFLVQEDNVSDYVEAIVKLVKDPVLRYKMSVNALKAINNRTWEKGSQRMVNVWKSLTKKNAVSANLHQYSKSVF